MKVSIYRPKQAILRAFAQQKSDAPYTYAQLGATKDKAPSGFKHDFNRIRLGRGEKVWQNAKVILDNWQQFPDWTAVSHEGRPRVGDTVAVAIRVLGFWWLNSCRIVYRIDDEQQYGYAYGTLQGHFEKGEERFWIERDQAGNIWYCIRAFSRPNHWWIWLSYPFARSQQKRFVQESMQLMKSLTAPEKGYHYEFA